MGLIMNGLLKVPMQFFILLTGVMVFVFFQFNPVPLNFNPNNKTVIERSAYKEEYHVLEKTGQTFRGQKSNQLTVYRSVKPGLRQPDSP